MTTTTIIAVTNSYNDTVTMLPPSAHVEGIGQVIFHNNPRVEFDGSTIHKNFDHHVDFRITKNKLHNELLPDAYSHYPRLKRRTQYLNVFKFNEGRDPKSQITIPHYYMATLREGEHVGITNFGLPECDKVVIKEQLGARGSNQVVVPTNMLTTLLKHARGHTLGETKEMFPDLIYTDNSDWEINFFDDPSDLFISELITNVKAEYRLLVGGDKIYGRERVIKAGPYPQANLETDKFHTVQEVIYTPIEEMFPDDLVSTLYDFAEFIDLPLGSIDLYSTTDGGWGIFEYSTQFAFMGANPVWIRDLLLNGIKKVICGSTNKIKPSTKEPYWDLKASDTTPVKPKPPAMFELTQVLVAALARLVKAASSEPMYSLERGYVHFNVMRHPQDTKHSMIVSDGNLSIHVDGFMSEVDTGVVDVKVTISVKGTPRSMTPLEFATWVHKGDTTDQVVSEFIIEEVNTAARQLYKAFMLT